MERLSGPAESRLARRSVEERQYRCLCCDAPIDQGAAAWQLIELAGDPAGPELGSFIVRQAGFVGSRHDGEWGAVTAPSPTSGDGPARAEGSAAPRPLSPWTDRLEAGARHSCLTGVVTGSGSLVSGTASAVDGILDFLVRDAIPHLVADQEVLFPALERILGLPAVTAALDVEAAEIRAQTERLESLAASLHEVSVSRSNLRALGRTLSALDDLLHSHAQRERSLCASACGAHQDLDPGCATLVEALASAARRAHDRIVLVAQPAISYQAAVVMRNNPVANRAYAVTLADLLAAPASRARPC